MQTNEIVAAAGSNHTNHNNTNSSAPKSGTTPDGELVRTVDWKNARVVQILDAASRCFAKSGFAGTTIQDIATEAGLTKSMVHYYFESKQSLIQELQAFVYERHLTAVKERLEASGPNVTGRAQDAMTEVFELVKDTQFLRLQLEILAECGRDPAVMDRMQVLQRRSRDLIGQGARQAIGETKLPVSDEVASTLIGAVLHGLRVAEYVEGEKAPTKEAYALFVQMVLNGLNK
jgi:AcrR family transcriptional regulator